jgi:Transposase, Mutator family.
LPVIDIPSKVKKYIKARILGLEGDYPNIELIKDKNIYSFKQGIPILVTNDNEKEDLNNYSEVSFLNSSEIIFAAAIKQPRIDGRGLIRYSVERFTSNILPRYLRRMPSIDNLIPVLYLKGISTNDFPTALSAILGEGAFRAICYKHCKA